MTQWKHCHFHGKCRRQWSSNVSICVELYFNKDKRPLGITTQKPPLQHCPGSSLLIWEHVWLFCSLWQIVFHHPYLMLSGFPFFILHYFFFCHRKLFLFLLLQYSKDKSNLLCPLWYLLTISSEVCFFFNFSSVACFWRTEVENKIKFAITENLKSVWIKQKKNLQWSCIWCKKKNFKNSCIWI